MGPLESALVAIVSGWRRQPPLSLRVAAMYQPEFLERVGARLPQQPMGQRSRWKLSVCGSGGTERSRPSYPPSFLGARLQLMTGNRWQYDELDEESQPAVSFGYDGSVLWSQNAGGDRNIFVPRATGDPYQLDESAWQFHAGLVVREMVEPVLLLPAIAIEDAIPKSTAFGEAVTLLGHRQLADRVESALVEIEAHRAAIDIHATSGVVLSATNFDAAGSPLVSYWLEEYRVG